MIVFDFSINFNKIDFGSIFDDFLDIAAKPLYRAGFFSVKGFNINN